MDIRTAITPRVLTGTVKYDHPKLDTPERLKIALKPHQRAILCAARILETNNHEVIVNSQFAVLADRAGAGKTVESLAIIACQPDLAESGEIVEYGVSNLLQVRTRKQYVPLNIVLCPSSILVQWRDMTAEYTDLSVMIIPSGRYVRALLDMIRDDLDLPELIIINSAAYNTLSVALSSYCVSRLFVDEADKIETRPHSVMVLARFTYFISASHENLTSVNMPDSIFASVMSNLYYCRDVTHIILRSEEALINEGMQVVPPVHYIKEFLIGSHELLSKFAGEDVRQFIIEDNYEMASRVLGVELVPYTIDKIRQQIILSTSETEKVELTQSIERLNRLIREESRCCVCYDELSIAAITPCECMQKYCSMCLSKWLNSRNTCPTCRRIICKSDIIYNYDKLEAPLPLDIAACSSPWDVLAKSKSKLECFTNFIKYCVHESETTGAARKVILFSSRTSHRELQNTLEHLGVPYSFLHGNVYKIAGTVQRFKSGNGLMFIIANNNRFGRGLNLQECTDIFMYHVTPDMQQIFARAQRYGRSQKLNIYHLVYTQERDYLDDVFDTEDVHVLD